MAMVARFRYGVLIAALASAHSAVAAQAVPDSLPPGVTGAMISKGKKLFAGDAICFSCHGADGRGMTGPNLTDQAWLHSKGAYDDIVAQIRAGVPPEKSKSGVVMPPKGGTDLNDEQIRAIAAYVWSLSQPRKAAAGK
jgi:mono/diheme cytochrome c family protein